MLRAAPLRAQKPIRCPWLAQPGFEGSLSVMSLCATLAGSPPFCACYTAARGAGLRPIALWRAPSANRHVRRRQAMSAIVQRDRYARILITLPATKVETCVSAVFCDNRRRADRLDAVWYHSANAIAIAAPQARSVYGHMHNARRRPIRDAAFYVLNVYWHEKATGLSGHAR